MVCLSGSDLMTCNNFIRESAVLGEPETLRCPVENLGFPR